MYKFLLILAISVSCGLSVSVFAQQSGEVQNTCEVSGGRWVGTEGGNWACCWSDWGCYGCVDGNCKMKCETQRCKDANGQKRPGAGEMAVEGLAPTGNMTPIVPKKNTPSIKNPSPNTIKKTQ